MAVIMGSTLIVGMLLYTKTGVHAISVAVEVLAYVYLVIVLAEPLYLYRKCDKEKKKGIYG